MSAICLNKFTVVINKTVKSIGWMPVLDAQFRIGAPARTEGIPRLFRDKMDLQPRSIQGSLSEIALYKFYKKPMANSNPNRSTNTLPERAKMTTAVQEVIRRAKNTSRHLEEEVLRQVLWRYMEELKLGGYAKPWRKEVLQSGLIVYGRMWASEVKGGLKINRPEATTRSKRRAAALTGNKTWYKPRPKKIPCPRLRIPP